MVTASAQRLADLRKEDGAQSLVLLTAPPVPSTVYSVDPSGTPRRTVVVPGQVYTVWVRLETGEEYLLTLSGGIA